MAAPRKPAAKKAAPKKTDKPKTSKPRVRTPKVKAVVTESAVAEQAEKPSPTAHLAPWQFQPGQSGNPAGRAKGSRNKLGEAFLTDLFDDWKLNGKAAIQETRLSKPHEYVKVVASLLPKQVHVKEDVLDDFDDDELSAALTAVVALRQARGTGSETVN